MTREQALGQMLAMLGFVDSFPREEELYAFVVSGIRDFPGVDAVAILTRDNEGNPHLVAKDMDSYIEQHQYLHATADYCNELASNPKFRKIKLESKNLKLGCMLLLIEDDAQFMQVEPFLDNFGLMITFVVEIKRNQQKLLNQKLYLAEEVQKRTHDLLLEIEQRKKVEEILRKNEVDLTHARDLAEAANIAKSRFLAEMSHDLRTPLNAIIGFSELVLFDTREGPLSARQTENIKLVVDAGRHLLSLVEDLLNISAIETGHVSLKKEIIDTKALIEGVAKSYDLLARKENIRFHCDLGCDGKVFADKSRIEEVLHNLFSNAKKFTPPGGLITLGTREDGDDVIFFLIDTGPGIEKDDFERIFIPFNQGKNRLPGVKDKTTSVGLGLAISKKLVEMHGGLISVTSCSGAGSCFSFTLPKYRPSSWLSSNK
jgi:signal transduction histidine kinase